MSPPSKHRTRSTGKAPDIPLPPNGKIPQAPKPGCKTQQRQPEDADKDIELDPPAPTPAPPRPAPRKKSGAVSRVAPGAGAEDEMFIPPRALQKRIPDRAAGVSDPPPPAQPRPPPVSPPRSASPDVDDGDKTPPPSQPRCDETP
ncbi:hypothetical protein DXG01_014386, partial [Tephrocybe rancida]